MIVQDLLNQARDILQDTDKVYWSDSELVDYINNGARAMSSERMEETTTTSVALITDTYEYTVSGVLRYISAKDSDSIDRPLYPDDDSGEDDVYGVIIEDYDRIYVNTPLTGKTLTVKHIALPSAINLSSTVRSGDENALKYYVLAKAYEKEQDTENFQKAQYFMAMYLNELRTVLKNSKLNYRENTTLTKGYYY